MWGGRRTTADSATGSNNSSWADLIRFYPCFANKPRFATKPLVLLTVSRFATKPLVLLTVSRFATKPSFVNWTPLFNCTMWYGATKCAGLVHQNVRMWCGKMWWVGATKCAGTVRQSERVCCEVPEWCDEVRQWRTNSAKLTFQPFN